MAMSAGICGKRAGHEEIFGSSPLPCSSAKKSRRSSSDETVSLLLQMFPSLDSEVVERVFRNNNGKLEDAIECLGALPSMDVHGRDKSQSTESAEIGNCDQNQASCSQMWEESLESSFGDSRAGLKWVELFVDEMMNAANLNDARGRAARILEAFERCISEQTRVSKEVENASLKEHLQRLLNDNQILKRAVAIQHERHLEQEENTNGVLQLKNDLNQYQEKVRSLELSNYALKVHLQRARESSNFISGQFPPDIF